MNKKNTKKHRRTHDHIKARKEVLSPNFKIKKVQSTELKKEITEKVLRSLSGDRLNSYYEQTRSFYLKNKFIPLEVHPTLWGQENPCLQMIKNL